MPTTTASMSAQVISASASARRGGLAHEAGHRDVAPGRRVLGLADADDGDSLVPHQLLPFEDGDQVLLQAGPARAVGDGPVGACRR